MKTSLILAALVVAASGFSKFGVAQTGEGAQNAQMPPAEIVTLIDTVFKAFNSKDFALLKSVYGDNLVIIDGLDGIVG